MRALGVSSKEESLKYVLCFAEESAGLDVHVSSVCYCLVNIESAGFDALLSPHERRCVQVAMEAEVVCCSSSTHAVWGDELVFQLECLHQCVQVTPEGGCQPWKNSVTFRSLALQQ